MAWLPIRYRDFHDIPRAFVVEYAGSLYFFDCPFEDALDQYPNAYRVYQLDPALSGSLDSGPWHDLASIGRLVGEVPTRGVRFDETRRAAIDDSAFRGVV